MLGGELGYGPWSLVWWWMQNRCWAERDLTRTLRNWRREAEAAGMTRIADLCGYLQADKMAVRLVP